MTLSETRSPRPPRPHKISAQKRFEIAACIESGLSCREAAAQVGVSVATAIRWTKRLGMTSRRSRLIAPQTRQAILQALRDGATQAEAAARFGVSVNTAARLAPKPPARPEKAARREALFAALRRGLSRRQAAAEVGLSVATAIRWAREADLAPPPRPRPDPALASQVRGALAAGMTRKEAAETYGLSRSTVARLGHVARNDADLAAKRERLMAALRTGLSCRKAAVAADLPIATAIRWARAHRTH